MSDDMVNAHVCVPDPMTRSSLVVADCSTMELEVFTTRGSGTDH